MKLKWNGIEFGGKTLPYYIYWFDWCSKKENRHWGKSYVWHDGPHKWWCFWYFNIGWSTPWTKTTKDM